MKARPLLEGLQYCTRCCIPETQEGVNFDEMGVCQACRSAEQKMHINWQEREKELAQILKTAKAKAGNNYDCIVPISGGKDSMFQVHVITQVYGMKPLAVTFNHNWYSETGWYNLQNCLETFNIDHIMFTPNRDLVNRLARHSICGMGDTCWHCHAGVGAFPLHIAAKFNIPLIIWGESLAESSGRASFFNPVCKFDREYFLRVSAKLRPEDMICEYLSSKDLYPFELPSIDECERVGIYGIYLGDYLFWDEERQTEFLRDTYGWRETEMEGTYKRYKGAECIMTGMHDFTCYLKRGYGRATFHASLDVRNGLLTREEGFELANFYDQQRPQALDYYLKITGYTEKEFYEVMHSQCLSVLKDVELPVNKKTRQNQEKILPYPCQIIEKYKKYPSG